MQINNASWIDWTLQEPSENEAGFVIFFNRVTCKYWMQFGTVVTGQFWYDNVPIAWQRKPRLPQECREHNVKVDELQAR